MIDKFKLIDGALVIPGTDAKEDWTLGNFYRREASGWVKYRNIPNGVHVFDLYKFDGKLFAATGPGMKAPTSCTLRDNGHTWHNTEGGLGTYRIYTLFELNGVLYGSTDQLGTRILKYLGGDEFCVLCPAETYKFFPGMRHGALRIVRPTNYKSRLVYITAQAVSDHQSKALALCVASDPNSIHRIDFENGEIVRDVIAGEDGNLYVLTNVEQDPHHYTVVVHGTTDLSHWREVVRFKSDTFARSFERLNNDFYFGLGGDATAPSASVGNILRVKNEHCRPLMPAPAKAARQK